MKPPRFTRAFAILLALGLNASGYAQSSDDVFQLIARGDIEQARKITDARIKSSGDTPDLLFASALIADKKGHSDKAVGMYLDLIDKYPGLMGPYNNLAIHYANAGDYKSAVAILEKAMVADNTVAIAYKNLTALYARQASAAYRKALNSKAPPAPLMLATIEEAGSDTIGSPEQPGLVASAESFIEQSLNETAKSVVTAGTNNGNEPVNSTSQVTVTNPQSDANNIVIAAANAGVKLEPDQSTATKPALATTSPPKIEKTSVEKKPAVEVAVIEASKPTAKKPENNAAGTVTTASARPSEAAKKLAERNAAEKQALINHVKSWASAWSDRDVDRYLSHYSVNFKPRDNMNLEDWKKQRYGRLRWREFIIVKPSQYSIDLDKELATVNFNQYYKSERFEDTIRKTLKLRKENGQWRITQELL